MSEIISVENPSYFNQGLMELGALICIPKIHRAYFVLCVSIAEDMLKVFKRITSKSKAKAPKMVPIVAGVLQTEDGRYVINKRPSTGLLANMWEFLMLNLEKVFEIRRNSL